MTSSGDKPSDEIVPPQPMTAMRGRGFGIGSSIVDRGGRKRRRGRKGGANRDALQVAAPHRLRPIEKRRRRPASLTPCGGSDLAEEPEPRRRIVVGSIRDVPWRR